MPNYQNGKIYKIESLIGGCVYYGSTTKKYLCNRFAQHRSNYRTGVIITSGIVLQYPDAKIYLVELYPCNSKDDLTKREGYYIKKNECVNRHVAGRTQKEWQKDNKEKVNSYIKKYYVNNKEKVDSYFKQYRIDNKEKINLKFICECGIKYNKKNKSQHKKSQHHNNYMNNPFYKMEL